MHNSFAKKNGKIRAASLQQLIVRLKLDAHEVNRNIKTKGESGDFNSKLTTEWRTSSQLGRARAGRWPRSSTIKKIRPLRYGKWLGVPPLVTTSQMGCVVSDNTFCRFQFWLIGESKIFFPSLSLFLCDRIFHLFSWTEVNLVRILYVCRKFFRLFTLHWDEHKTIYIYMDDYVSELLVCASILCMIENSLFRKKRGIL